MECGRSSLESLIYEKPIRLSKSSLSELEKLAVKDVLDREFLGMGLEVQRFEQALSQFFGRPALCVATGTAALHLAVQAIGLGSGDEVLVQSLTYVASFQAISATGARPIACEIIPETLCIDWRDAESRITKNTKAIMPVHYSGGVGELDAVYAFANKHGLRVIEDAAHAFGTEYDGNRVGQLGDIACFSFDGIKNITSGEGGCIVTDDEIILQKIRDARLLGVEKDTEKRYLGERSWDFDVKEQGWRYHMSDIMAAIGLTQLSRFQDIATKRRNLAKRYVERLSSCKNIKLVSLNYEHVVPHIFVVELVSTIKREDIRKILDDKNIKTGIHYKPNHWLSFYKDNNAKPLPVTDTVFNRLLTLPLHGDLRIKDVDYVCDNLIMEIT